MTSSKKWYISTHKRLLGRFLPWVISLLPPNELPLAHVFQMLDGPTNGPGTFYGSINKQLREFVSEWGIAQLKVIPNFTFPTLASG